MQVQLSSDLFAALNYIAIGLLSIFYGFFATGRDGLMYDMRLVRGPHRVRWNITFYTFTIYSILLSLSQWSVSRDCSDEVFMQNKTNFIHISNECNGLITTSMWLWIVMLVLDAFYIITLLSHRDYRSERLLKERIKIRRIQKTQLSVSLALLCVRILIVISRFGVMVSADPLSAATFLNVFIIVFLGCNLYAHSRAISLYTSHINDLETKNIVDTEDVNGRKPQKKVILDSSSSSSEDERDNKNADKKSLLHKPSSSSRRPVVKIVN